MIVAIQCHTLGISMYLQSVGMIELSQASFTKFAVFSFILSVCFMLLVQQAHRTISARARFTHRR
jgi:hypothetical protein